MMTANEVAKNVMSVTKMTQADVAKKSGLAGASSVAMYFTRQSMRVDSLLTILNACGYELIARDPSGKHPEFLIGESMAAEKDTKEEIREMIREMIAEEIRK